ncbi:beta carbonic anhydrase 5, chloroplastic-like isoform X3 [Argentina anserina]|uniref:beta carbonic anhydrase 5, chloroplastic-like isoform X3 n=1 Tax=Argentina anserina TaxID=57926 RepID=UPI0021767A1B|nr:beta carbonic anhydrase 5, chloroplastic-like isoform X3 [Potentilla anserina]
MVWPIRQKASCIFAPTMAAVSTLRLGLSNTHLGVHRHTSGPNQRSLAQAEETHIGFLHDIKHPVVGVEALSDVSKAKNGLNFGELKDRFLSFKKQKFLKESEHFQNLAQVQDPKFMVIACADSRVCPSNILGFQPGEALMIRNVANLVPPFENGASETNAALEFAVNTLEVENIFVIGHSSCAGIETLMTMQDDGDSSSFTHRWVVNAKVAKLRTKAATLHLSFDQQCRYCEKESINHSLLNLLAYPWIADKVRKKLLSIHGGYYDFLNCAFDKWTLDVNDSNSSLGEKHYSVKDRELWL